MSPTAIDRAFGAASVLLAWCWCCSWSPGSLAQRKAVVTMKVSSLASSSSFSGALLGTRLLLFSGGRGPRRRSPGSAGSTGAHRRVRLELGGERREPVGRRYRAGGRSRYVLHPRRRHARAPDFAARTSDFAVTAIGYQGVDPVTGVNDTSQGRPCALPADRGRWQTLQLTRSATTASRCATYGSRARPWRRYSPTR